MDYSYPIDLLKWRRDQRGREMHSILLVESNLDCQLNIKRTLAGLEVNWLVASTAAEANEIVHTSRELNLILLDLSFPDGNGLELLSRIRKEVLLANTPTFFLTATDELVSKVAAFELGADDYLVKSMKPVEIRSRIEARLRRNAKQIHAATTIQKGNLLLELPLHRASIRTQGKLEDIQLTAKEFKILCILVQNESTVFTRQQLVEAVWSKEVHVLGRTVDSHIYGLRKKLAALGRHIESVPPTGYRFLGDI
jgi:DNA-binding response OmpR family regulator